MARPTKPKITDDKRITPAFRAQAGKGRPKGVPNKTTTAVKQALIEAFEQMGGVARLTEFAAKEPGEFYKLWIKILPQEITGANGGPVQFEQVKRVIVDPKAVE